MVTKAITTTLTGVAPLKWRKVAIGESPQGTLRKGDIRCPREKAQNGALKGDSGVAELYGRGRYRAGAVGS